MKQVTTSRIDPVRLHAVLASADRAKAVSLAAFDTVHDNRARLKAARVRYSQIEQQRDAAPSLDWREKLTERLKAVDSEITVLQRVIAELEAEAERATAESTALGRLAIACRAHAVDAGVPLPGPVPEITRGMR